MRKKHLYIILGAVLTMTVFLIVLGFIFNKSENEKRNGLARFYDVSANGTIAYVVYKAGKPGIYLHKNGEYTEAVQLPNDKKILDLSFSKNGSSLAFISSNKDKEAELVSTVHLLEINTQTVTDLFTKQSMITEVQFDPKAKQSLFYLSAGTYKNYSPVASERPHEFDVYAYDLSEKQSQRVTNLKKYSMSSLKVSSEINSIFLQMDDDADVKTAEDSFEVKQRIFKIPIDNPDNYSIVSNPDRDTSIFDFTLIPNKEKIIYQSIRKTGSDGIYQYELYKYNRKTKEEEQLTHIGEHTSNPVLSSDNQTVYFMVNEQFGRKNADYHLYRIPINGKNAEEVSLRAESNE